MFILYQDQPSSVKDGDYGKAIALHAGMPPELLWEANVSFRLHREHTSLAFDDEA